MQARQVMTPTPQPTPPGDVRDVITRALQMSSLVDNFDPEFDELREPDFDGCADDIIAALTDAGYTITRPEAGMVTIPLDVAKEALWAMDDTREIDVMQFAPNGREVFRASQAVLRADIEAAAPDTGDYAAPPAMRADQLTTPTDPDARFTLPSSDLSEWERLRGEDGA